MFKGCCYLNDGTFSNTVALRSIEEALGYLKLQVAIGKEARILDDRDRVVIGVVKGKIILPEICSAE
jgi:hypothetical protein